MNTKKFPPEPSKFDKKKLKARLLGLCSIILGIFSICSSPYVRPIRRDRWVLEGILLVIIGLFALIRGKTAEEAEAKRRIPLDSGVEKQLCQYKRARQGQMIYGLVLLVLLFWVEQREPKHGMLYVIFMLFLGCVVSGVVAYRFRKLPQKLREEIGWSSRRYHPYWILAVFLILFPVCTVLLILQ